MAKDDVAMNKRAGKAEDNRSRNNNYKDIDRLVSAEGLVSIISLRRSTGVITFAIFKEYERDGAMEKSNFVPETMIKAYRQIVDLTADRIKQIRAEGLHLKD